VIQPQTGVLTASTHHLLGRPWSSVKISSIDITSAASTQRTFCDRAGLKFLPDATNE